MATAKVPLGAQGPATVAQADSVPALRLRQVVLVTAVIALLTTADGTVAEGMHRRSTPGIDNVARQLDHFGELTVSLPILGGMGLVSLATHNPRLSKATLRATASLVLAGAGTRVLKRVVGRLRPVDDPDRDGYDFHFFSSNQAFPSGHAAAAFALATSLGDDIGHSWARVGLYALASGTAWARLAEEEHWLSDVAAGAAVGILSAKFAAGKVRIFGLRAPRVLMTSQGMGVGWTFGRIH